MSLTKVTDQAVNIRSAVGEFMVKFFVALAVVMLVCFLSMGWRVGVVVAAAVPLTLASVFSRDGCSRQELRSDHARLA
jgi:multidrug efflux pump subunit AcrB